MKCYTYKELIENMTYTFEKGLRDRENSVIEAISYCYLIYESDLNYGLDEKIIISLINGRKISERTNRVFIGQYKLFESAAKEAIEKQNELNLSNDERTEVVEWAMKLLEILPNMEIEHDQRAK